VSRRFVNRLAKCLEIAGLLNGIEPRWRRYLSLYPRATRRLRRLSRPQLLAVASGDIPEHWRSRRVIRRLATVLSS
jgi:hypothetical protein